MKPQKQLTDTDCVRACIATLLEYKVENVPDFTQAPEVEGSDYPAFWLAMQSWLSDKGLLFLEIQLRENVPWMPLPIAALCIIMGETDNGVRHAIVGRCEADQFIPVFNPKPGAELMGVGSLGFLVPRDPAMPMTLGKALEKVSRLAMALPPGEIKDNIGMVAGTALGLHAVNGHKIIEDIFNSPKG